MRMGLKSLLKRVRTVLAKESIADEKRFMKKFFDNLSHEREDGFLRA